MVHQGHLWIIQDCLPGPNLTVAEARPATCTVRTSRLSGWIRIVKGIGGRTVVPNFP